MLIPRLVTATVLLVVCISAMLLLPAGGWAVLLLPVLLAAAWEWGALAGFSKAARTAFTGIVGLSGIACWLLAERGGVAETSIYLLACLFWIFIVIPWLARGWHAASPRMLGVVGWLVLVPSCLALARLQVHPAQLLAVLAIIWLADTAAYFSGRAWGRHKLAPTISPGKTWEGAAGAAVAVAVYYFALRSIVPEWGWWSGWAGPLLFVSVAVLSVVGDLFESAIKRKAGVKDSGTLLPGHGGVLDRIDSITATLPVAALLMPYAG